MKQKFMLIIFYILFEKNIYSFRRLHEKNECFVFFSFCSLSEKDTSLVLCAFYREDLFTLFCTLFEKSLSQD